MPTYLSIDIGGSQMGVAAVAVDGDAAHLLHKVAQPLPEGYDAESLLRRINQQTDELLKTAPVTLTASSFDALGVNVPGLADPATGMWVYACFSGIRDLPIASILANRFDRPVFIENDVNACAIAERRFGCCRDCGNFLWITISNGIGGGLMLDGKIVRGAFGNAGEIGHFHVVDEGVHCGCGNLGCLEAEAAGPGITKFYANLSGSPEPLLPAKVIAERARAGDVFALATWRRTGHLLGRACALAANLIGPGKIVLGGGVSGSFDLFYPSLRETFDRESFGDACRGIQIERTTLGNDAATYGAAAICQAADDFTLENGRVY